MQFWNAIEDATFLKCCQNPISALKDGWKDEEVAQSIVQQKFQILPGHSSDCLSDTFFIKSCNQTQLSYCSSIPISSHHSLSPTPANVFPSSVSSISPLSDTLRSDCTVWVACDLRGSRLCAFSSEEQPAGFQREDLALPSNAWGQTHTDTHTPLQECRISAQQWRCTNRLLNTFQSTWKIKRMRRI